MVGFVLTGHGQFSNGLKSAVDMVAGDQPNFAIVPFEGSEAVTFGDDLRKTITDMAAECDGVLVFVDLWGGTPFNQSMIISSDVENMEIVTGTNLPMLVELVMTRAFVPRLRSSPSAPSPSAPRASSTPTSRLPPTTMTMRCNRSSLHFIH